MIHFCPAQQITFLPKNTLENKKKLVNLFQEVKNSTNCTMDFDEWHLNTYSLRCTACTVTIKIHSSGCWVITGYEKIFTKGKSIAAAARGWWRLSSFLCQWLLLSSVQWAGWAGDAQPCQPSHLSKVSQQSRDCLGWGGRVLLLQQGGADRSGLLPMELWKGGKVWSLPGMAVLAQLPAGTPSHQQRSPSAAWAGFTQTRNSARKKALCQCSGHTLLLQHTLLGSSSAADAPLQARRQQGQNQLCSSCGGWVRAGGNWV